MGGAGSRFAAVAFGLAIAVGLASPAPSAAQSREVPSPAFRFGYTGGLALVASTEQAHVPLATEPVDLFSAGFGLDLRAGAQLTPWLAIDAHVQAHTILFSGDARAGLSVELSPHRQLALALGAGVGSMWVANIYQKSPSADFASGQLRVELRFPELGYDIVVAVEGQLGAVIGGDVPGGTWVGGARIAAGMLVWP